MVARALVGWIHETGTWTEMHNMFTNARRVNIWNDSVPLSIQELGRRCSKTVKKVRLHMVPVNLVDRQVRLEAIPIRIRSLHLVGARGGHWKKNKEGIKNLQVQGHLYQNEPRAHDKSHRSSKHESS